MSTHPVKTHIRNRDFFKLQSVMETGADSGMWTFARYQNWLKNQTQFHIPGQSKEEAPDPDPAPAAVAPLKITPVPTVAKHEKRASTPGKDDDISIEIESVEGGLESLIKKLGE